MNANDFKTAFPDCTDIRPLSVVAGQKEVAAAKRNGVDVALKVFKSVGGDVERRVIGELAATRKLKSEYVPPVFDSGKKLIAGEDRYYIVEQFINGRTYEQVLAQEGARPIDKLLLLLEALLTACRDFAAVGVTHRDLKPANLMMDSAGKFWVLDFGFCRHDDLSGGTPTGAGVGTPGYLPLEQQRVIKAEINVRADLFAAGVIAYESVTGAPNPWRAGAGNAYEIAARMKGQELPRLTITGDKDGKLSDFIAWLVQRMPTCRPQSAEEALEAFAEVKDAIVRR